MATILIVDNDSNVLGSYVLIIRNEIPDCIILTAVNELEAINLIETHGDIDVVITDLMMSNPNGGIEVLNAAKEKDPLIMVIVITAHHEALNRREAFVLGAFDCIEKAKDYIEEEDELVFKTKNALLFRNNYKALIESEKKINSYKKYFDPIVFEKIRRDQNLLLPKNRTITIAFWDIRGFSFLSETLKTRPDLIAGFLKEYFEASSRIIFENQGVLDKFMGDGIMALFGAFDESNIERENEDNNAITALKVGKKLRDEFNVIYNRWKKEWSRVTAVTIDIGLGCGIHTGEALVGNLGTDSRDHFTAIGPHVNLASRIESKAGKGEIRFSVSTKVRVDDHFKIKYLETLTDIKNIPGPHEIYVIAE